MASDMTHCCTFGDEYETVDVNKYLSKRQTTLIPIARII
jgi:hypothetical protein